MASHTDRNGITGKDCRRCYTWKPLNDYYSKGNTTFDGKDSMCKVCFNERKEARANGVTLTRVDEHRTVNGIEKKRCPTCKTWKAISEYNKCANRRDGLAGLCRPCFKDARSR